MTFDGDDTHFDPHAVPANDNGTPLNARLLDLLFELLSLAPEVGYSAEDLAKAILAFEPGCAAADIVHAIYIGRRSGYVVLRKNDRLYLERRVTQRQLRFLRALISTLARSG